MAIEGASEQPEQPLTIVEYSAPAFDPGPGAHVHAGRDEAWFTLEGELALQIGEDETMLTEGGFAFTHGDIPHSFSNRSDSPVRFLLVSTEGPIEDFLGAILEMTQRLPVPHPEGRKR